MTLVLTPGNVTGDFGLFVKKGSTRISEFTVPAGTVFQTPEGLRAEDEGRSPVGRAYVGRDATESAVNVEPILTPLGEPDHDGSYQRYLASLTPCPGCGRVDEMDNIEGRTWCAACSQADDDPEDVDGWPLEWGP